MRFIRELHRVDPELVVPSTRETASRLPRTAIGHPICARQFPTGLRRVAVLHDDGEVVTLEYALSDPRTLRDEARTHAI